MGLQSPDSLKPSRSSTKPKKNGTPLELKRVCKVDWSLSLIGVVSHQHPPFLESLHLNTRHPQIHTLRRVWDMSGDEDNRRRSKETQDLERSTHPQPRENFFSRALFALAAKWGMKKYCRLVEISYNDTFKLKGLGEPPFLHGVQGLKPTLPSRNVLGR